MLAPLLGRLVIAWYFLSEAWLAATNWHALIDQMMQKHIPAAPLLLTIALVVLVLGACAILIGFHTRHGAMLLFAFSVAAAALMHDFWHMDLDPAAHAVAYDLFARDIAIAGALLFIMGVGPGRFAFDNIGEEEAD